MKLIPLTQGEYAIVDDEMAIRVYGEFAKPNILSNRTGQEVYRMWADKWSREYKNQSQRNYYAGYEEEKAEQRREEQRQEERAEEERIEQQRAQWERERRQVEEHRYDQMMEDQRRQQDEESQEV